jgi:DNA-binding NarL/FixJ family response regulator
MVRAGSPTILIADDHAIVREGLCEAFEAREAWTVCGQAETGPQAVRMARELAPDVLVLDISLPELSGVLVAREVRRVSQHTEVLIFTMHDSEQLVREALSAGARGYVLKSAPTSDVLRGVEALLQKRAYFCARIAESVLRGYLMLSDDRHHLLAGSDDPLTGREVLIAQMLAEGRGNKVIASMLGVSAKTVESHRGNIMRKLDAHSLADVVRYAVRHHLIEP